MGLFRFLLAFCVVATHVTGSSTPLVDFNYMNATTAVEVFFVISGIYMQLVLREKYTVNHLGKNWIAKFYASRYSRLMPVYLACLVATITYLYISRNSFDLSEYPHPPTIVWEHIFNLPDSIRNLLFQIYFVLSNIFIFFQDAILNIAVINGQAHLTWDRSTSEFYIPNGMLIPQAWSLGVELSFYAVAPFLLRMKNNKLVALFSILMAAKLYFIFEEGGGSDFYYRAFPFALPYFLLGAIVYRYRESLNVFKTDRFNAIQLLHVYSFGIFVTLLIPNKGMTYSVLLVIVCSLYLPSIFYATKNNKIDRYIGEASYPIYVFHILLYMIMANNWEAFNAVAIGLQKIGLTIDHFQLIFILTITSTLAISALFVWIEFAYINPTRSRLFETNLGNAK